MRFSTPLYDGILVRRYKRFLADVALSGGEVVTAHCPNSGSMLGLDQPGSPVLLSLHDHPRRKLKYTWELVRVGSTWVGVNTGVVNRVVEEGIRNNAVRELRGYPELQREVRVGANSRVDFKLAGGERSCFVEVKNVTLAVNGTALFPDAVTERGRKHVQELARLHEKGHRAVVFFMVNREDCHQFAPATEIDPRFVVALKEAVEQGVEVVVYSARPSRQGIWLGEPLPFCADAGLPNARAAYKDGLGQPTVRSEKED